MLKYKIPAIPPSNNEYMGRNERWKYQAKKRQWAEYIVVYCRPKPSKPMNGVTVTLTYHFKDKRRRDPDNYSGKMILDGLVRAGIIFDDSFKCINLQLAAVYDKGGYTEITIEEVNSCTTK